MLPIVLPYFTPYEANVRLLEPARAQAAWIVAWTIAVLWTLAIVAGPEGARVPIVEFTLPVVAVFVLRVVRGLWLYRRRSVELRSRSHRRDGRNNALR